MGYGWSLIPPQLGIQAASDTRDGLSAYLCTQERFHDLLAWILRVLNTKENISRTSWLTSSRRC